MNPPRPHTVPPWDLPTVLRALEGPPFEPLQSSSLRVLMLKTALLSALASVKRVGDLQALSVNHVCLFVGFGNHAKGGPVTMQNISRWLVDAITLAYSSSGLQMPHRIQNSFHQRHRLVLDMVQRGVHFWHLWGSWLVLAVHISKVLQPGCPRLAGQSPFCLSRNLLGSLDQLCSSPSLLGLSITIWMPGVSSERHPGHGWPSRPGVSNKSRVSVFYLFLFFLLSCFVF